MVQTVSHTPRLLSLVQKRAALYIRVSTKKQEEEGYSIEAQKKQLLAACRAENYLLDTEEHIYEEVHTGIEYRERPVLSAMRQAVYRHEFDMLLVYSLDRLARNRTHQAIIIEDLKYYGVTVQSLNKDDHADDDSIVGEIIRILRGYVAEEEHKKILKRTQDGMQEKIDAGKHPGVGIAAYGFAWNGNGKERTGCLINETKIAMVQRMFAMAYAGKGLRGISDTLTREGIPTPSGKSRWCPATVAKILKNPAYIGKALYRKQQTVGEPGKKKRKVTRPESEQTLLAEGVIPAVIDEEIFFAVQEKLRLNKAKAARNNKDPEDALLRCGHIFCGYCGEKMAVNHMKGRHGETKTLYRCRDHSMGKGCKGSFITAHLVDNAAWEEHAVAIINDPNLVAQMIERKRANKSTREEADPVKRRHTRLSEIEAEMQNIVELSQKAPFQTVLETAGKLLNALEEEKKILVRELHTLANIEEQYIKDQEAITVFEKKCATYRVMLQDPTASFTYQQKQEVIEFFGIKARVWRLDHSPHFKVTANPPSIVSTPS